MTTHEIEKVNCLIGYLEFFVKKGYLLASSKSEGLPVRTLTQPEQ